MNATVKLPLAELDILRQEPEKVKVSMENKIKEKESKLDEAKEKIAELKSKIDELNKTTKGITITVKEKVPDRSSEYSYYNPFIGNGFTYIPSTKDVEISSVTYTNMDEIVNTIRESIVLEHKEKINGLTKQLITKDENTQKMKDSFEKQIRILKNELLENDKDEIIIKLRKEIAQLKKSWIKRIFTSKK